MARRVGMYIFYPTLALKRHLFLSLFFPFFPFFFFFFEDLDGWRGGVVWLHEG